MFIVVIEWHLMVQSFGKGFANNAAIFGVDKNSSSHTDNFQNNVLVLGKRPIDDINGRNRATVKRD